MKGKDLINIGIFSAIYFVIVFIIAMLGMIPIFLPLLAVLVPMIAGIPFMLFLTRVKKFGMIWIMSIIMGIMMLLTGMSWPPLVVSVFSGLLAELVYKSGNYKSAAKAVITNGVFSLWVAANFLPLFFAADTYWSSRQNYGQDYIDTVTKLMPTWMCPVTFIIMIISSYLIYAQLDNAGKYSALLRTVDVCVGQAQDVFSTPQMDISGEDIVPEHCDISAENISFAYEQKRIIDGISLSIPEHTTTALVGPSGGGKTTLTSLISRFWDVDEGKVTLDGRGVREYSMDSLMRNFSFVFQSVYLFADTIANNIRFGQPDAPMEKVIEAAKKACCHDFIMQLPDGYDTVIGEGGASLSGGEKQRISIARAIMNDSPVIVLDEATANVDPENEAELMKAIEALTKEKTIIMIAHRLKTVRHADQILVIENGRIAQQGTHDSLMTQDGIYRTFVESRREAASWRL